MANKKKQHRASSQAETSEPGLTLKDLLGKDTLAKLKEQADTLKQEKLEQQEMERRDAEAARVEQQKLNEKNFEYLLNNSDMDWKKHKS